MQMQVNKIKELSDKAKMAIWRKACRKEKIDRDREEEIQRISAKEIIKELPSKIEKVAREGGTALRVAPFPCYIAMPGIIELNFLSVGSVRKYLCSWYDSRVIDCRRNSFFYDLKNNQNHIHLLPNDKGALKARIIALWLLRNGFKIGIKEERDRLGNTRNKWLVAYW